MPGNPSHPSHLLRELESKAKKRFGQHFLAEPVHAQRMAALAELRSGEPVLEIGPGLGILTEALLARGADVTAIELDRDLLAFLSERHPSLHLVPGDATKVELPAGTKVVANLPYNVGTKILLRLLALEPPPPMLVVMLQREVAERMVAPPGDRQRGSLSVAVQARARVRVAWDVPPGVFYPPPKVHSSVLHLVPDQHPPDGLTWADLDLIAKASFTAPRKTLRNSLSQGLGIPAGPLLERIELAPTARPADLTVADVWALARAWREASDAQSR